MTTPAPSPRRKDAIATRERLVRAGLELFTTQGYRGTTTLDIAAKARISEATIYRHFVGKEALFNEVYRHALRWGVGQVRAVDGDRAAGTRERLGRLARALVEQVPRDPTLVMMLLRRHDGAALEETTQLLVREFREALGQIFATGKQQGAIRAGSAELWGAAWLALVGFVVERVVAKEWGVEHASVGLTIEAAWDAIAYRAGGGGGGA